MAEKYDVNAALKRLDEIEARLKATQGMGEFSKKKAKKVESIQKQKKIGLGGLNANARKQMEELGE